MQIKIYEYNKCSTCVKALKFLKSKNVKFQNFSIVTDPPSKKELSLMLTFLKSNEKTFKNLFNTSGVLYRELGISEKLKVGMTEQEALELLSKNGKLIKRPFCLGDDFGLVGFNEDEWKKFFKKDL